MVIDTAQLMEQDVFSYLIGQRDKVRIFGRPPSSEGDLLPFHFERHGQYRRSFHCERLVGPFFPIFLLTLHLQMGHQDKIPQQIHVLLRAGRTLKKNRYGPVRTEFRPLSQRRNQPFQSAGIQRTNKMLR